MVPVSFKPIDSYLKTKLKGKQASNSEKSELKKKYSMLKDKRMKKFVKKAEKLYDQVQEVDSTLPLFSSFLNKRETELLFQSYGKPKKFATNRKVFMIENIKNKLNQENGDFKDSSIKKELENKWKEVNENDVEKKELDTEYDTAAKDYEEKMFDFARNLPENRVADYKAIRFTKSGRQRKSEAPQAKIKLLPFEIFLEDFKKENPTLKPQEARDQARTKFKTLSSKKKLRLINQAADLYDAHIANSNGVNIETPFFKYLNKNEQVQLMTSYGMPKAVAPNLTSYYMGLDHNPNMKDKMNSFRLMPEKEKQEMEEKRKAKFAEYNLLQMKFLDKLPAQRRADYEFMKNKKSKQRKSGESPIKKIKEEKVDIKVELQNRHDEDMEVDNEDKNSVYESADGSEVASAVSSIRINESKDICDFINKQAKTRPENTFSVFLLEEIKWNVKSRMNETETSTFLKKSGSKWLDLSESDKEIYKKKYQASKKELKNNIKEFLMNEIGNQFSYEEVVDKINAASSSNKRKIEFDFGDPQENPLDAYLNDDVLVIHSSVEKIYLKKIKKENGIGNHHDKFIHEESAKSLKRKLNK